MKHLRKKDEETTNIRYVYIMGV